MRHFPKLFAMVVAGFWLLATQHCRLEAAGLLEAHTAGDQTCCPGGEAHCSHDGCEMVEDGSYRVDSDAPVIPAAQFAEYLCFVFWNLSIPPLELREDSSSNASFERPLNWVPTWQFVQRAALSPRAPSLV